jgi:hypothetical protein
VSAIGPIADIRKRSANFPYEVDVDIQTLMGQMSAFSEAVTAASTIHNL